MKSLLLPLVFFLLAISTGFCQSADEAALKNIIESETQAFTHQSFADVVQLFWLLDDKTRAYVTIADGTQIFADQSDLLANTSVPPPGHATFIKTNYRFIINGNIASSTYDQVVTITATGDKIYSHEMHIFQKSDGLWKIHLSSVHQYIP
jgi:hypothetical protein